ncbi:hypothetical protein [Metasolibacillus sp.]|uniref:hypothetical protein n=1 Tax=Metasolibacillus sp. TaxID=2703680 RepID=UPI0025E68D72|nr:hypothetical protein [Metasolibacillus sp.]MCT6925055.1 hypothetical protein [Metasolibacillus sp.]MCT6941252.1 hypothetical protein [Metasolibacillus sp.]
MRNKKVFFVVSLLFVLIMLVGCNKKEGLSNPIFNWEGANYVVTNEPLPEFDVEEKVGETTTKVTELPSSHGEGFALPIGTELYKIKDIEITHSFDGMMAVKVDEKFKVARRLNEP